MLPGIGSEARRSFCHRFWGDISCGTNGWQCRSCSETETRYQLLLDEERKRVQEQQRIEAEQHRILEEARRKRDEEEARKRDLQAKEAEKLRQEQQRLEAERQRNRAEQERLERARQEEQQRARLEEERRQVAAAAAIAKQTAERMHAEMLALKAKAEAEARLAEQRLKEWEETFCVGRWVQVTSTGPHQNMFALVLARPSQDGTLKICLFFENVSLSQLLNRFADSLVFQF